MAKNNELDMCDVNWWDELKTHEEKDKYCQENYGISYMEWMKEIIDPTMKYDLKIQKFRPMTPEEKDEYFIKTYGLTYAQWREKFKYYTVEEIYNNLPNITRN